MVLKEIANGGEGPASFLRITIYKIITETDKVSFASGYVVYVVISGILSNQM